MDNSTTSEKHILELRIARVHSAVILVMSMYIYNSPSTNIVILAKSSGFKSKDAVFENIKTDPLYSIPTSSKVAEDATGFVDSNRVTKSPIMSTSPCELELRYALDK